MHGVRLYVCTVSCVRMYVRMSVNIRMYACRYVCTFRAVSDVCMHIHMHVVYFLLVHGFEHVNGFADAGNLPRSFRWVHERNTQGT